MLEDPLWQLLWVPPCLPYYQLCGPFAAAAARGFRNFRNYRIRILFFCGKLHLYPL